MKTFQYRSRLNQETCLSQLALLPNSIVSKSFNEKPVSTSK